MTMLPLETNVPSVVINPLLRNNNKWYLLLSICLLAGVHFLGVPRFFEVPYGPALGDALLSWLSLGFLVFIITNTLSFYHPAKGHFYIVLLVPMLIAYAWHQAVQWLMLTFIHDIDYRAFISGSSFYRLSVSYLMFTGTFLFSLVWYRLGEKEDNQRRQEETDKLAKEAELFKLRQQLQPHFLFNSLNSINALIGSKPALARDMIQKLSSFLRGTLKREDQKLVSLGEELEYLSLYLQIEEVRFGNRLKVEVEIPETHRALKLPPLILQPLIENAIKFGLYGTLEQVHISLSSKWEKNRLQLSVRNPFDEDAVAQTGTGFGLKSVRRRLQLLYGQTDLLVVERQANHFEAQINIPIAHD
jgi:signal transduction histidine kinase